MNKKGLLKVVAGVMAVTMCASVGFGCGTKNYAENNTQFFIGATGPLTGEASSYGESVLNGANLAVEEINNAGGLNGYTFKFEMKDDGADATNAKNGYNQLYEAGMQISLGSVTSGSCESFAQKAKQDNVFFMTPSASAANVIENRSNGFRVCFGDPDQGVLAAEAVQSKTSVGVFYDESDDYSSGIFTAFKAKMTLLGKTVVETKFNTENKTDFTAQAEALKNCDAVVMTCYYTQAALCIKKLSDKGFEGLVLGCDGFDGIAGQNLSSVSDDITIKYITPFDATSNDAKVSAFVNAYKAKYNNQVPDQFAADGYDAVYAIYNAMKNANVSDVTISPSELCELVKTEIVKLTYVGATGSMTWNADGQPTKVPQIVTLSK